MSISSIFGSPILLLPKSSFDKPINSQTQSAPTGGNGGLVIECSSRPNKKATAHHMKTRPKKSQPWDIRRKPTVYPPLPVLPPDWTLVSSSSSADDGGSDGGSDVPASVASPSASAS